MGLFRLTGGCYPELRRKAKVVNFGLLYGMSAFGLQSGSPSENGEAQELVRRYFHVFPGVREYMEEDIPEGSSPRIHENTFRADPPSGTKCPPSKGEGVEH
jgi:DNA polymerase I-like protein with 3'-5' exonuclease and polymerase domains